jgi:glutamate dehydrogenase
VEAASDVRRICTALTAAIEAALADNEQARPSSARIDSASRFLTEALQQRTGDTPIVNIDRIAEGEGMLDSGLERRIRLAVVNSDMPFLVDSIAGCLSQAGLAVHVLIHPVLPVVRDETGQLIAIGEGAEAKRESVIYIEADRIDARGRRALEAALHRTLDQVRAAVGDWRAMIDAMLKDSSRIAADEGGDLLRWFLRGNLTQLGHEVRTRDGAQSSALGVARTAEEPLLARDTVAAVFAWFDAGQAGPLILKSNRQSRVHRRVLIDLFILPVREAGAVTALSIHAGLWTSAALAAAPYEVPLLGAALSRLMDRSGYDPNGHSGKALVHALTYLPHDIMIALADADRQRLALTAMSLGDRPRPQLALTSDALGRHLFAFVWLPRDDMSTMRRQAIAQMLSAAANAPLLSWSIALDESGLALLRFVYDLRGQGRMPDECVQDAALKRMVRGWAPAVEAALAAQGDASRAAVLADRYANGFPAGYREGAGAAEAATDILRLHRLAKRGDRSARLYLRPEDGPGQLRLKLYSLDPITLSQAVPALENFGFRVLEEMSTAVGENGALGHIQKFILALDSRVQAQATIARSHMLEAAIGAVLEGWAENDRFNALLVGAALDPEGIVLLRAIFRYLRQTGSAYGLSTVVDALHRAPAITERLIALFRALHDPEKANGTGGEPAAIDQAIEEGLAEVAAIDDDRILRLFRAVIRAVLRTNAFAPTARAAIAFKIDSAAVPGLPSPVPWREIWVYSPRVEGIHLRAGPIARGGLRWSDRRDDFRTEILGLMKAQRVKNAVIVPTGAKGGFYPKQLPDPAAGRDAWITEGTECYRLFIRTLLSITDNVVKGKVRHPKNVVIRDGEDPYFVVAADKGTASFSDIANGIATEQGFWLGDAFASGGSNGYDHKAMGITARGAWISVQRHFREMGVDVQTDPVSVIGVGDMSGDVFGNGMLLSKAVRLVAAFDHRHIFIDPDPDPAKSWAERERLFRLPRSSWDDYDKHLISKGGGVFARSLKSIPLSPEMQAMLGTAESAMDPAQLISALLTAPVDLLWFGGIGTYVKAAAQGNADVGDSANDRVRVDAEALRAKVIGEGANLGVTQAGRIAYALGGGRINTDFIDNSAGVDCSDNEVNIKIALNKEVAEGELTPDARNALLARMTDSVAALVLEDNRLQALGLSIAEAGGAAELAPYVRLINAFAKHGRLDRKVEGLASDQELMRRTQDGNGLTRPELAILFATAKLTLQDAIEHCPLADDPVMHQDLFGAFPPEMRDAHGDAIARHQLRREIVATELANRIINRLGVLPPFALIDEEGCPPPDVATAFVVAEALLGLPELWRAVDEAAMSEQARILLFRRLASAVSGHIGALCSASTNSLSPGEAIGLLRPGMDSLREHLDELITASAARQRESAHAELIALGVPRELAKALTRIEHMGGGVGIADMARKRGDDAVEVAHAFTGISAALGLDWLQAAATAVTPTDPWERLLISGVERDIQQMRFEFLGRAGDRPLDVYVRAWLDQHVEAVAQFRDLLARAQMAPPGTAMIAEVAGRARALLSRK